MRVLAIIGLLFFCLEVKAAYRVYKLKVTQYEATMKRNIVRTLLSTLDHLQYENYNAGYGVQKVVLVDTWYCPGDTRGKPLCPKPKFKPSPSARDLASHPGAAYDKPKRPEIDFNRQPVIP